MKGRGRTPKRETPNRTCVSKCPHEWTDACSAPSEPTDRVPNRISSRHLFPVWFHSKFFFRWMTVEEGVERDKLRRGGPQKGEG